MSMNNQNLKVFVFLPATILSNKNNSRKLIASWGSNNLYTPTESDLINFPQWKERNFELWTGSFLYQGEIQSCFLTLVRTEINLAVPENISYSLLQAVTSVAKLWKE